MKVFFLSFDGGVAMQKTAVNFRARGHHDVLRATSPSHRLCHGLVRFQDNEASQVTR